MEIVLLIVVLVLVIIILTNLNSKFDNLQDTVYKLHQKIDELKKQPIVKTDIVPNVEDKKESLDFDSIEEDDLWDDLNKFEEQQLPEPIPVEVHEIIETPEHTIVDFTEEEPVHFEPEVKKERVYVAPEKSWFENFRENNPDLEKFVGENLINKIGILILVLGISFFVKYAIDKEWINETARVGIGILAGSLVMGVAHRLKKNYQAFSSVMVAGAISIFYFTIAIAFHDYHLFSQTVAFAIMVVITIFSTLVSVAYNRQELAVLSLIGGFAVPFMVSTGQGNYVVLFSYIIILNIGILGIAYFKKWNLVTLLSFLFTIILFVSWYSRELFDDKLPHKEALAFATVFYFLFSITAVLNNVRSKGLFSKIDYFIIVANTFVYFALGLGIIHNWGIELKGLFTLSLAIYNLMYAAFLYKKFGLDKNAVYLLIGFVLTFVTITIPVQFQGNQITLFWACEAVLLFWLSQKSKIGLFKIGAMLVQFLTIISLMMDWEQNYSYPALKLPVIFNAICITGIVVLASLIATYFLLKKETEKTKIYSFVFDPFFYGNKILWVALLIAYFVGILEIVYQSDQFLSNQYSSLSLSATYHYLFCTALVFVGLKFNKQKFAKPVTLLIIANIFLYLIWFYKISSNEVSQNILSSLNSNTAFYFHYLILACVVYFVWILCNEIINGPAFAFLKSKFALWALVFCGVYILSNELIVHSLQFVDQQTIFTKVKEMAGEDKFLYETFISDDLNTVKTQVVKIGYPILWGVLSFALLIFGIRRQLKQLRIIALSLLGLTIVKLFVYDINNVSETGKIIAFILLGVLILIISFVYQKIKKLVVDENLNTISDEKTD